MRHYKNFIEAYLKYTDNTEPSTLYRTWVAVGIINAVLQRKCYHVHSEKVYTNEYIVLIGPSGCRKGTAMRPASSLLQSLGITIAPNAVTRRSIMSELESANSITINKDNTTNQSCALTVFSEEITVFFGAKDIQLMQLLIDWYDGHDQWDYKTEHAGNASIKGVWLNIIGATTPDLLQESLPKSVLGGGLSSRIVFVFSSRKEKIITRPSYEENMEELLAHDLGEIHQLSGEFKITDDFFALYDKWYQANHKDFTKDSRLDKYRERRSLHLRKLCMSISASLRDDMIIDANIFNIAIDLLRKTEALMIGAYSQVGKDPTAYMQTIILDKIKTERKTTLKDIYKQYFFDISMEDLTKILISLETREEISLVKVNSGNDLIIEKI